MEEKKIDYSMFWDVKQTLTHNALFNLIVGNRGGGKSFGCKKLVIDRFIKNREQFGYIRRYKTDLKKASKKFFDDIAPYYPDYEFRFNGNMFYMRIKSENEKLKWTDNDVIGYAIELSDSESFKSIPFPRVTTLIFDEFLIKNRFKQYLDDETEKLFELYETVARPGTDHPRVILFMLANAITITNPYFLEWNLRMPSEQDKLGKWIWKSKDKKILVEEVKDPKFIEAKLNSEFGQLIKGTRYAQYSINNEFLIDDEKFIQKKTGTSRYWCTLIYKDFKLGIWVDMNEGLMFVSRDTDPSYPIVYSLTLKDHQPNTMFFKNRSKAVKFKSFIENYKIGLVRFEDMNCKNLSYEIIRMNMNA